MARLLQLFSAHQADFFQDEAYPDKTSTTGHFIVVFEDSGTPFANFDGRMPVTYNNSNLKVVLHWASTTTTTGAVVWQVAFERLDEDGQSITADGFAAALSVVSNVSGTADALVYATLNFSNAQADGVQLGESFRIRITRNTGSGSDTMVGNANILNVGIEEV